VCLQHAGGCAGHTAGARLLRSALLALASCAGKGQVEHRVRRQPAQAKQMPISKKVEQRIWPYLSPYADPVIEKVESSSYYKAAVNHLKPIAANGM